ncbi:UDP-N-acetylglucosamine 4-epimerase [Roseivirga sp. 4D4]|uniref:NAD-dependent epimerase/dehydratase family protein n=1 Tax=Roseivirga sp. 4D4 TaxID=1889784 RepID=UPI000853B88D|nr:NAD-dependent epimerase/dehydratase family protein [Roseivirga sp. 4D4]OEK02487.1 UDP-N-acetylglucosamine 4-epimerase [Roseivirga sp. 4D4]
MIGVIGGSGFVGSFLLKEIETKNPKNFDKNSSPFYNDITVNGNVLDTVALDGFLKNKDTVVLLAAEHRDDVSPSSLYYDVNVQGTKNVLASMDKYGAKNLIFTSSVAIYGLNRDNPNETQVQNPFNHYGKSKWEAEKVIKEWYDQNPADKSVTIIRPTVIFGERNRGNVYNLLKQICSGRFLMIGKGQNKKSMAYVGNVVAFIKNRLERTETGYQVFNYIDTPDFTMTELLGVIDKQMNLELPEIRVPYWLGMLGGYGFDLLAFLSRRKLSISSVRVKKFCATTQFDATKVHATFKAPYSLEEGLKRTLEHEFINPQADDILFFSE